MSRASSSMTELLHPHPAAVELKLAQERLWVEFISDRIVRATRNPDWREGDSLMRVPVTEGPGEIESQQERVDKG